MTEKEFTQNWIDKIRQILRSFPEDFLGEYSLEYMDLPKKLLLLNELMGAYEITDLAGNTLLTTQNIYKAKYVLYANRTKPVSIPIPRNEEDIKKAVKEYESHMDTILKDVGADYNSTFKESEKFLKVSASIFNSLNLQRY